MRIRNFSDAKSILFDNLTVKQTIFKNTFWLAISTIVSKFLKFILFVYAARILGATEYGKFIFALAFIALFEVISDFGLNPIVTRDLAKDKKEERKFPAIFSFKISLGILALILVLSASPFITDDPVIQRIILILAISALFGNFYDIIYAFFQARQKMEYQGWGRILESLIICGIGLFILFYFPSAENLSFGYLLGVLATLIFILALFHFKIQRISIRFDFEIWKRISLVCWPLALVAIFNTIYNHTDSVMMGYFGQITETGWYNAAYRIVGVALLPMSLVSMSFFPVLSRAFQGTKERIQTIWNQQMELMIFLSFPIVAGGILLAPQIIEFFYGEDYAASALAFQILILMAGIVILYDAFRQLLIVANQQKRFFWAVLGGAVINIVLNLILIPQYSLYGAAAATLITNILIFLCLIVVTLKFTSVNPFNLRILNSFIGAILASSIMYFVISQPIIYYLHLIFIILIGATIYLLSFLAYQKLANQFLP